MPETLYRVCNLCEAMCGLAIEHEGREVLSVRGDQDDPFSRGAICPKGALIGELHADPDRLRRPLGRTPNGEFEEISWKEAFDRVEAGLKGVIKAHGRDAVALYFGNPTVHNLGAMLFARELRKALRSKNSFSATSMDQLPHHAAAHAMYGHSLLVPVPDLDRTDFFLVLGANPLVSNGSLMTAAGVERRLKDLVERGGRWVVLDPRKTESARQASEHVAIRPGTDVYFLLALLHVLVIEGKPNLGHVASHVRGLDAINDAAAGFAPEAVESVTGVDAAVTRRLAHELRDAKRAVVYGRLGVCTQAHGGLNLWLINVLNVVSGHLDTEGGAMFTTPAVDVLRATNVRKQGRWKSRVRGLPEFEGELPISVLAEEIETPGEGQVRALLTVCGNPVLSAPGGGRLDELLPKLDFVVSVDIYLNETSRHADVILPTTTALEAEHYDLIFNAFAVRNVAKWSPAIAPREPDQRHDWEVLKELVKRLTTTGPFFRWSTPRRLLNLALLAGPYGRFAPSRWFSGLSLSKLMDAPHGLDLGPLQPIVPSGLRTKDRAVNLAPSAYTDHLPRLRSELAAAKRAEESETSGDTLRLIGRRGVRDNNSWLHNLPKLMRGASRCTVQLHPSDAARLGVQEGALVRVSSSVGSIDLPAELTDTVLPGVACVPHGYGHGRAGSRMQVAAASAGVSVNEITDPARVDPVTGNAAFSGQRVRLEALAPASGPPESADREPTSSHA